MFSLRKLLSSWYTWDLTVLGRITVAKYFLLSKLTFLICTIPDPPLNTVNDLTTLLFKFIWRGNQMAQDYNHVGLDMIDVSDYMNALKITWLRRLLVPDNSCSWVNLFHKITDTSGMSAFEGGSVKLLHIHKNTLNSF